MRESSVNQALQKPRLSNGISSTAMGVIWGPAVLAFILIGNSGISKSWLWALIPLGIGALAHSVLRWIYRKDPRIFAMYAKYSILSTSYHPDARETLPESFERPAKVGRGLRI
ncbi:VirB3 family type IV secretion system protein [Pseudoduganella sp. R-34]|jgi:type IV secretory pathway TrbD component|uniref:VirB3 family type IV secretion system protein n=1 Tax=Pseudoduganella sp. R-34 TaxID=3404062 RepID=UPI003CEDC409